MTSTIKFVARPAALALLGLVVGGCVLEPHGTRDEQKRLADAGAGPQYQRPVERRELPELGQPASWHDVLHRAFLANGALEAAWFEWQAALARIPQRATYPNTNLAPSFSYLFSGGRMKSWDRTTVNVGFDPMENLAFPTKVAQAGKVALAQAREAGERFRAAKFELQRKVLTAYFDLLLHDQRLRIQRDTVELLRILSETAANRVQAGGSQQELLKAQTQHRVAEDQLATLHAEHRAMVAMLNGMLARPADASIELPEDLPAPRPLPADDDQLIATAVDANPELSALAQQVRGRRDALELARMQFIPDVNPMAAFTGGASQMIGAIVILPTTWPEIQGAIDESRAMMRASQAMLRQTRADRAAGVVAALVALRSAERQANVFEQTILPRAQESLAGSRQAYAAGSTTFLDLIDSQRMLLEVRETIAEARIERERRLVELEALAGVDIETLNRPTTDVAHDVARPPSAVVPETTQPGAAVPQTRGAQP